MWHPRWHNFGTRTIGLAWRNWDELSLGLNSHMEPDWGHPLDWAHLVYQSLGCKFFSSHFYSSNNATIRESNHWEFLTEVKMYLSLSSKNGVLMLFRNYLTIPERLYHLSPHVLHSSKLKIWQWNPYNPLEEGGFKATLPFCVDSRCTSSIKGSVGGGKLEIGCPKWIQLWNAGEASKVI